MTKRQNIINNAVAIVCTLAAVLIAVILGDRFYAKNVFVVLGLFLAGAIVSGFFNTLFHELGHVIAGKKNGFAFVSMNVWFFKWVKIGKRTVFEFAMMGEQAGYTETVPVKTEDMEKRLKKMTLGGIYSPVIFLALGVVAFFLTDYLPFYGYYLWVSMVPVSVYFLLVNFLPMKSGGVYNDGALLLGLKKKDDSVTVNINLLKIQAELYLGKTPSEIDGKLYFDLPQLVEDDINFLTLLTYRLDRFIDAEDYDAAKKTLARAMGILDYFPKSVGKFVKAQALYAACTFDFDEDEADELTYELEKYLNKDNGAENIRIKLAYLLYVTKDKEFAREFYEKGIKECGKCVLRGKGEFEKKLFGKMEKDL